MLPLSQHSLVLYVPIVWIQCQWDCAGHSISAPYSKIITKVQYGTSATPRAGVGVAGSAPPWLGLGWDLVLVHLSGNDLWSLMVGSILVQNQLTILCKEWSMTTFGYRFNLAKEWKKHNILAVSVFLKAQLFWVSFLSFLFKEISLYASESSQN